MSNYDNIPDFLQHKPRWTVWQKTGISPEGKVEKIIRKPNGTPLPEGFEITKNTGTFKDVIEVCKQDVTFYPGFYFLESDGILFIDYDQKETVPNLPTYTERSLSGNSFHVLGWFKGPCPKFDGVETYTGSRWCILTGDVIDGKKDINDLNDLIREITKPVLTVSQGTGFKLDPDKTYGPNEREPTLMKWVRSMKAKGTPLDVAVVGALQLNRQHFSPPHPDEYIVQRVKEWYERPDRPGYEPRPITPDNIQIQTDGELDLNAAIKWEYDAKNEKWIVRRLNYQYVAEYLGKKYSAVAYKHTIFLYNPDTGIYFEDDGRLQSEVKRISDIVEKDANLTGTYKEIRFHLESARNSIDYPFNTAPDLIPVGNGIVKVNLETGESELLPFDPLFKFNYRLAVKYDKDAPTVPIKKYLETLHPDIDLLVQIPAHCLLSMLGRTYKRAYFLKGDHDSGKSTFLTDALVTRFFGKDCVSTVSLQNLLYDRFRLAMLEGKVANVYADLSDQRIGDIGLFKLITGGDYIPVERKHKNPYDIKNQAVLIFSANKYPKLSVGDDAFWSRWITLNFESTFTIDTTFAGKMFTDENISGLLNLVLAHIPTIVKNGLQGTGSVEKDWLNDSSSAHRFINEYMVRDVAAYTEKRDVYAKYIQFCDEEDLTKETDKSFTQAIKLHGGKTGRHEIRGRQEQCYDGFSFPTPTNTVDPQRGVS